jgi:hypothetical protein
VTYGQWIICTRPPSPLLTQQYEVVGNVVHSTCCVTLPPPWIICTKYGYPPVGYCLIHRLLLEKHKTNSKNPPTRNDYKACYQYLRMYSSFTPCDRGLYVALQFLRSLPHDNLWRVSVLLHDWVWRKMTIPREFILSFDCVWFFIAFMEIFHYSLEFLLYGSISLEMGYSVLHIKRLYSRFSWYLGYAFETHLMWLLLWYSSPSVSVL